MEETWAAKAALAADREVADNWKRYKIISMSYPWMAS